jgi:SAM-dependent methyltransferase
VFEEWDATPVFDEAYLYFGETVLTEERSNADAELIWRLAGLQPHTRVLDLACGHGRIANRLAAKGARLVGLDLTALFLDHARRDAKARHVDVDFIQGDVRNLPWSAEFDVVVSWYTPFGYFDDEVNRDILRQLRGVLRPHGQLLLELAHAPSLMRHFAPVTVLRRGNDVMVSEHRYDALTGRLNTNRTVIYAESVRTVTYSARLFAFPEVRDWLVAAGFTKVEGYDIAGEPLQAGARRMIVSATAG